MKNYTLIFGENNRVMPDCEACRNFEENDWCTIPRIEVKYYSCKVGGCKKLAEHYNNLKFVSNSEINIIKKFLK